MNNLIREKLQSFHQITAEIIEKLNQEDYDVLEDMLNTRQNVIEDIESLNYDDGELREAALGIGLLELENKLNKIMNEKKQELRLEIEKVKAVKNANNNYQKNYQAESLFFNKKI